MCVSLWCIWGLVGSLVHYLRKGGMFLLFLNCCLMILSGIFLFTPMGVALKVTGFMQLPWSMYLGGFEWEHA